MKKCVNKFDIIIFLVFLMSCKIMQGQTFIFKNEKMENHFYQQWQNYGGKNNLDLILAIAEELIKSEKRYPETPYHILNAELSDNIIFNREKIIKEQIEIFLNHPSNKFILLNEDSDSYSPENGELVSKNWIFYLEIPILSDHLYWIVIPRGNENLENSYLYGFN